MVDDAVMFGAGYVEISFFADGMVPAPYLSLFSSFR